MSRDVEVPKLDWLERYKRLLDVGWGALVADEEYVYRHFGQEELTRYWRETRPMWSGPVGKKLSEKLGLKPDMEGAIKLLGVYSQEVWGFGDPRYIQAKLESPTKGVFTNLACRGWEKMQAHHKETHCDVACAAEFGGVLSGLSPKFKMTITKARPRGDDRCEYTVTI